MVKTECLSNTCARELIVHPGGAIGLLLNFQLQLGKRCHLSNWQARYRGNGTAHSGKKGVSPTRQTYCLERDEKGESEIIYRFARIYIYMYKYTTKKRSRTFSLSRDE